MAGPCRIVTVVGNPKGRSRTLEVALEVSRQVGGWVESSGASVQASAIDLAELAPVMFDWESGPANEATQQATAAEVLIVASPTYKATYTGLLKAFLDRLPPNALEGTVAIPVMVAAAPIHALAVETYLRPLLIELGASCPTRGLFVLESQLPELEPVVAAWLEGARASLRPPRWAAVPSTPA
jgi:FMN reductase